MLTLITCPQCIREAPVFEFRLRILDARERDTDPFSYLGIVEGFPEILVNARTVEQTERDLVNVLEVHLRGLINQEATQLQLDDFPTVRAIRVAVVPASQRLLLLIPSPSRFEEYVSCSRIA